MLSPDLEDHLVVDDAILVSQLTLSVGVESQVSHCLGVSAAHGNELSLSTFDVRHACIRDRLVEIRQETLFAEIAELEQLQLIREVWVGTSLGGLTHLLKSLEEVTAAQIKII